MPDKIHLENILFLDIETVPEKSAFDQLDDTTKELWAHKSQYQRKDEITAEDFYERAGIWAEFGKIICISVGYFIIQGDRRSFRITTFHGEENKLLQDFKDLLDEHFNHAKHVLCAHNGKEKLDLFGKNPWEVPHIDTMELWKFGDYKHYTSLKLMAHVLGIPSPKEDIDGSMVRVVYYEQNDLNRIITYCELDVLTTAQVYLRLRNQSVLKEDEVKKVAK